MVFPVLKKARVAGLQARRRGRDLNPRWTFRPIRDFQSRSLDRSDTSPAAPAYRVVDFLDSSLYEGRRSDAQEARRLAHGAVRHAHGLGGARRAPEDAHRWAAKP